MDENVKPFPNGLILQTIDRTNILEDNQTTIHIRRRKKPFDLDESTAPCCIFASHSIPVSSKVYYFEIRIQSASKYDKVGIGFMSANPKAIISMPGLEIDSVGYHGDDGYFYNGGRLKNSYGPKFNDNCIVGCGVDKRNNILFFTKNGQSLGATCHLDDLSLIELQLSNQLFPAIGVYTASDDDDDDDKSDNTHKNTKMKKAMQEKLLSDRGDIDNPELVIEVNFGQTSFAYDVGT